jgi:peptide/nickel transport system permease protein
MKSFVVRRTVWTVVAMYLLLSASFFTVALTPDPNQQLVGLAAAQAAMMEGENPNEAAAEAIAAYDEARNRDRPLLDRYRDWVVGYTTFQWGWSYAYSEPVTDVIGDAVPVTLAYMIPALLISWILSLAGGVYAAFRRGTALDGVGRAATYVGVGLPAVIVVMLLRSTVYAGSSVPKYDAAAGVLALNNLAALAIPVAVVAASMLVMQWRMVRAESLDLLTRDFVTALRADGAGDARLGRHVLKNATAPLLAVFNAEVLTVLFLTMYVVEQFLGIPGLGSVTLTAFNDRDIGLVLATVLLPAFVGLMGNFLTDVVSAVVDPRVSAQS